MDLWRSHAPLADAFADAFRRVVADGQFILGPDVGLFEREVAARVGVSRAVGVSSGTDALLATLMALGIGPGDEVIVPTLTFFATAGAVARVGATPRFADVDPDTLLMDTRHALSLRSERTRLVIVVHLFGQCAPVSPFRDAGLAVVEDVAQALGATDGHGREAGSVGLAGCFSFFPTKPLGGLGDGGLVTTDDPALADRVELMRGHGARRRFHHDLVGGNFRLDTLQAALLRLKLPFVDGWNEARRRNASDLRRLLEPVTASGDVRFLAEVPGRHVVHQLVVRAQDRDRLLGHLAGAGVGTAVYYPEPLHVQPCFEHLRPPPLPMAEAACGEVIALPCFPGLTEAELTEVALAIRRFYGR